MKSHLMLLVATLNMAAISNLPAHAGDIQGDAYSCGELWSLRNQIFKANGYCFKSPKAIKQFGNAGCQYDLEGDVALSHQDLQTLGDIKKSELRQGC